MLILTCEVVRVARQERQVNVGRQRQLARQSTQDVQPALGQVMEQGRWGSTERAGTAGKVVRRSIFVSAPASLVRHPAVDLSVKAAGPQQRCINKVRPRGGSDDAHALQPLHAIKLRKQLVHHSVGHTCIDTTVAAGQRGGTAGSHMHKLSASTMSGYEKPLSELAAFTCHSPTHLPPLSSSLTCIPSSPPHLPNSDPLAFPVCPFLLPLPCSALHPTCRVVSPGWRNGIKLVEEEQTWCSRCRPLKQLSHRCLRSSDVLVQQLRALHADKPLSNRHMSCVTQVWLGGVGRRGKGVTRHHTAIGARCHGATQCIFII